MRTAAAFAIITMFAFACSGDDKAPTTETSPSGPNATESSDSAEDGEQDRELAILGEPPIAASTFREQEQARIEQYGFEAVCVTGLEEFRSLVEDAPGQPTADNLRALEIVGELCADARE